MDYMIISKNRDICIKLGDNGIPETCSKQYAQHFENSKARNILDHLPKTLRKFNFKVEAIPDIVSEPNKNVVENIKNKVLQNGNLELSENILGWVDKFGSCYDVFEEAKQRVQHLMDELRKSDNELLDILHIIEIESAKDLYNAWIIYRRIRNNRKKRRIIKDEIMIIEDVLNEIDPSYLDRKRIKKAIDGLFRRKYKFRIVEEEDSNVV